MVAVFTGNGTGLTRGSGNLLGSAGLLGNASLGQASAQILLNAATGNLLVNQQDEFLVGRGPDVVIGRTYNSLGMLTDDNGDNWQQSTDRRILNLTGTANTVGSTVQRLSEDGSVLTYSWNASRAAYVTTEGNGAHDTLTLSNNVWTWTDGATRIVERYAAAGNGWRIVEQADTDGNKLSFSYNGAQLGRVTTADGSWVEYRWSGNSITEVRTGFTNLATGNAATLTRTRYRYDTLNRLSEVTVDLTPADNSIADGRSYFTRYSYDGSSRRVAVVNQSDGSSVRFGYDAQGRVISFVQAVSVSFERTTQITYGAGFTLIKDALGQSTRLDYAANGALLKITAPAATAGAPPQVTQFTYLANGDVATATDPLGQVTSFGNDGSGNLTLTADALGNQVLRTYGLANQLLTETRVGSDQASAAAAHTTRFAYDGENHLRYRVSAEGNVVEYRYTAAGELQSTIEYPRHLYPVAGLAAGTPLSEAQLNAWRDGLADRSSASIVTHSYDPRGNLLTTTAYGAATVAGVAATSEGTVHSLYSYDQAGRLASRAAPGTNPETFTYDGLGRMIATSAADRGTTSIAFSHGIGTNTVVTIANGLVHTATYNRSGELIGVTESGDFSTAGATSYSHDAVGRVRMSTDAKGANSFTLYDKADRKTADIDSQGGIVEYRYDAADRLVATIRYSGRLSAAQLTALTTAKGVMEIGELRPGSTAGVWSWRVYDKAGRLIEAIEGDGSVTAYDYDASGQLVRTTAYAAKLAAAQIAAFKTGEATRVLPPSSGAADRISRVFYDRDGKLVGTLDGEGYLRRIVYDNAGAKIEEIAFSSPTVAQLRATGSFEQLAGLTFPDLLNDRRTRYVHDGIGQLRYVVDAHDQVTEYRYDSAGRQTRAIAYATPLQPLAEYRYDLIKARLASSGAAANPANRQSWTVYDGAGQVAFAIDAEGGVTGFAYDAAGRVIKTTGFAARWPTSTLPDFGSIRDWANRPTPGSENRVTRNFYGARGELRFMVDAEGYITRNDYDGNGQLLRTVRWTVPIAATDATTIAQVNAAAAGENVTRQFAYDSLGRLTSSWDGEGNRTLFIFGADGLLSTEISAYATADEVSTAYSYDGAGRVATRTTASRTAIQAVTSFAYDGLGNLIAITDPRGSVTSRSYDRLGRLVSETDALLGVTRRQYDAFGDLVRFTDALGNASHNYYDRLGRIVAARDAADYVTESRYTVFGELASVIRRFTPVSGSTVVRPIVAANTKDATTAMAYDRLGRLVGVTDAEGYQESYVLDAFGQRISVRNKIGGVTLNSFDRRGLLTAEKLPIASYDSSGTLRSATVTNQYQYDARGNRIGLVEAAGLPEERVTRYLYDKADRLVEIRGPQVLALTSPGQPQPVLTMASQRFRYDARGNRIETIDANGARTLTYYDKLDRAVAGIDALGGYWARTYDKNGNLLTSRSYELQIALPAAAGAVPPSPPAGAFREAGYSYDQLDRLVTTAVLNIRSGAWNGSAYVSTIGSLTTRNVYDAAGRVIEVQDANGGIVRSYYDKLGRKVMQVDAELYATAWSYDAEGNVLHERRYATRLAATPSTATPPAVATALADRVTGFSYDRNGRRVRETRINIAAWTVNAADGKLASAGTSAAIDYYYNGLGQVVRKIEATGDSLYYSYDSGGRLIQETRPLYTGHDGTRATPTVRYYYNALGDLTLTRQGNATLAATDRMTRYAYGVGGRLQSMTDANGAVTSYFHDAAGNVLRQSYSRLKTDGNVTEALLYTRDKLGRVVSQTIATWSGSAWVAGDVQNTAYNAFGEVAQSGVNGLWQVQNSYDSAGRLWRSNGGDGAWRYFGYDATGNRTLTIESAGFDLAGMSFSQALAKATVNGSFVEGVVSTYSVFDRRNQSTATVETKRQLTPNAPPADLVARRIYNAFGEVVSETDVRGYTTDYVYNTLGRVLSIERPGVSITLETGAKQTVRPKEYFFYDISGRLVGVKDANGNAVTRTLLAGTGYGESETLVTREFHADGGVVKFGYDAFGDQRDTFDEIGRGTWMAYDGMGRLIQMVRKTEANGSAATDLVDSYAYDLLGQRIKHITSTAGFSMVDTTDYDSQGRVTKVVAAGGDTTTMVYTWSRSIETAGMGIFGGWTTTTTYANGRNSLDTTDLYGRDVRRRDLGGHVFTFLYDAAGRVVQRNGGDTLGYSYYNTGRVAQMFTVRDAFATAYFADQVTTYGYDATGNVKSQTYVIDGRSQGKPLNVIQNSIADYDELGRITRFVEAGSTSRTSANVTVATNITPPTNVTYEYDAVGNVRHVVAVHSVPSDTGAVEAHPTQDFWYSYDSMNRMVTSQGIVSGGKVVRGYAGIDIQYDLAGQRVQTLRTTLRSAKATRPNATIAYDEVYREDYYYDVRGNLTEVRIGQTTVTDNKNGTITVNAPVMAVRGTYLYDRLGRVTRQTDHDATGMIYDRIVSYNAKSQITTETVTSRQGNKKLQAINTYGYGTGNDYALGAVVTIDTTNSITNTSNGNVAAEKPTATVNSFLWFDGAVQSTTTYYPDATSAKTKEKSNTSTYTYNGWGQLLSVTIQDGRPRKVALLNDMAGQILRRDEIAAAGQIILLSGTLAANKAPHEVWYRFGGEQMGYIGNNGTLDTSYQVSVTSRATAQGTGGFRLGAASGTAHANFDQAYEPITSYEQGAAGGNYTVQTGDTLNSIAAQLWGDASLWYLLAEANGMSGATGLVEGQRLIIPAGVMRSSNTASTFNPYDPAQALGDTSPTAPKVPKKNKGCGVFGKILLVVIAIAVSLVTYGALTAALPSLAGFVGGAIAGAAGSIASQSVGVAIGMQEKVDWKGVAIAAVSGGIGHEFGVATSFVGGALTNAAVQGIAIVTGLQKKFDWTAVAVAGAAASVSGFVAEGFSAADAPKWTSHLGKYGQQGVTNMAGALAGATARSLVDGTNFGDNVLAVLPDVIGSTIGQAIGEAGSDYVQEAYRRYRVDSLLADTPGITSEIDENGEVLATYSAFDANGRPILQQGHVLGRAVGLWLDRGIGEADILAGLQSDKIRSLAAEFDAADNAAFDMILVRDLPPLGSESAQPRLRANGGTRRFLEPLAAAAVQLTDFANEHPTLANMGVTLAQAALGGGPIRSVVLELARVGAGSQIAKAEARIEQDVSSALQEMGVGLGVASVLAAGAVFGLNLIASNAKSAIGSARKVKGLLDAGVGRADDIAQNAEHIRQLDKYGSQGFKQLESGRVRYYGDINPATKPGEMVGRRMVREWNPATSNKRTWHETIDSNEAVRVVRPQSGTQKIHYRFDPSGKYIGSW